MTDKKDWKETIEAESSFTTQNRKPKALVTLDGLAVTEDGKLTKSNFFKFLGKNLDSYSTVSFTPEEAQRVHSHLAKLSTGTAAMVPLYCGGEICPFKDRCPLFQMKKHQLAKQCPIENQLLKDFTIRYFEEFEVDPHNWTEVAYVNELAEIDIYLYRLKMALARPENSELVIEQTVGMAPDGDTPIMQKQISPYVETIEKLQNRRSKVIKLMVGDRQEKYKEKAALKLRSEKDSSSAQSAMRRKLDSLERAMRSVEDHFSEKKGSVSPEDIINSDD